MAYVCVEGGWWPTSGTDDAPAWLSELPEGSVYVERGEQTVSIFWDEKAGSEGLALISQAIEKND
jgi:hypothetical protein